MKAINSLIFACGSALNAPPYTECGDPFSCQDAVELERPSELLARIHHCFPPRSNTALHQVLSRESPRPNKLEAHYHPHIPSSSE